jgi:hypothetical protein
MLPCWRFESRLRSDDDVMNYSKYLSVESSDEEPNWHSSSKRKIYYYPVVVVACQLGHKAQSSSDSSIWSCDLCSRRGRLGERKRSFRGHTLRALQRCSSIGIKQLQHICCDNLRSR